MSCPRDSSGTNTILCRFVRTNTHERANERRNDSIYHSQVLHPSRPIHVISKDRPSVATRQDWFLPPFSPNCDIENHHRMLLLLLLTMLMVWMVLWMVAWKQQPPPPPRMMVMMMMMSWYGVVCEDCTRGTEGDQCKGVWWYWVWSAMQCNATRQHARSATRLVCFKISNRRKMPCTLSVLGMSVTACLPAYTVFFGSKQTNKEACQY